MKKALRTHAKTIRACILPDHRTRHNADIQKKLKTFPLFKNAKTVLFYVSKKNEVDTHKLIQNHLELNDKITVIPITHPKTKTLSLSVLKNFDDLKKGAFDILELPPKNRVPIDPKAIDLVIVPGLLFDKRGHRLGHGHGYYDRLLKKITAPKIGLAYACQIVPKLMNEAHDVPVDHLITEQQIFTFAPLPT